MKNAFEKLKIAWRKYYMELRAIDWADVTIRAMKTFFQIAITYALTALTGVNFAKDLSGTFWLGFALSAGSAGVSAAWNTVLMPVLSPGKTGLDSTQAKLAIARAKTNSDTQPDKDDING